MKSAHLSLDLLAEVAAGDEDVAGAGDQQARQLRVRVHPADRVADAEVHRLGQRVPGRRAVDGEVSERGATLEPQVGRPEPVALGRAGAAAGRIRRQASDMRPPAVSGCWNCKII